MDARRRQMRIVKRRAHIYNIHMNDLIREKLKLLPDAPGVYRMLNAAGEIIYVGKAVNLKNRVRSYFRTEKNRPPKVAAMVSDVYKRQHRRHRAYRQADRRRSVADRPDAAQQSGHLFQRVRSVSYTHLSIVPICAD